MIRTQIQLTEEQHSRLKTLAEERSVSMAELVRNGVDRLLEELDREEKWERFWAIAGTFHDPEGKTDVSERHDDYLVEAWSHD